MRFSKATVLFSLFALAGCTTTGDSTPSGDPVDRHHRGAQRPRVAQVSTGARRQPEGRRRLVAQHPLARAHRDARWRRARTPLENPQTVTLSDGTTATAAFYGYDGDGPLLPGPGDLPSATHKVEASKTEPDKNTYLVLYGQTGADASYDYGTHFLFQGHELGTPGYITRINLDADGAHKVTVMAATDVDRRAPRRHRRLDLGSVRAAAHLHDRERERARRTRRRSTFPSVVEDISGSVGRGGYEGVQNDSDGNLWIVEDIGGSKPAATPHAKVPNSFVYRFVPKHKDSLKEGKLQVLQVTSLSTGLPIAFQATDAATRRHRRPAHLRQRRSRPTWVTIHDTDVDGTTPFNANDARQGQAAARRSSAPRTASSARARSSTSSSSTRPATPTRAPRRARRSAASAACSS